MAPEPLAILSTVILHSNEADDCKQNLIAERFDKDKSKVTSGDSSDDKFYTKNNRICNDDENLLNKQSHPDDRIADEYGGRNKGREGRGNIYKKPGRKPLLSEPSTKRKAQNRAAQRAFRERKETYLKGLQTKILDLQVASKAADYENNILRTQIKKMSQELQEYRERYSQIGDVNPISFTKNHPTNISEFEIKNYIHQPLNLANFNCDFYKSGYSDSHSMPLESKRTTSVACQVSNTQSSYANFQNESNVSPVTSILPRSFVQTESQVDGTEISNYQDIYRTHLLQSDNYEDSQLKSSPTHNSNSKIDTKISHKSNSRMDFSNTNVSPDYNISYRSLSTSSTDKNSALTSSSRLSSHPQIDNKVFDLNLTPIRRENLGLCSEENMFQKEVRINNEGICYSSQDNNSNLKEIDHKNIEDLPFYTTGIDWLDLQHENQFNSQLPGSYCKSQQKVIQDNTFNECISNETIASPVFGNTTSSTAFDLFSKDELTSPIACKKFEGEFGHRLEYEKIWESEENNHFRKEGDLDVDVLCSELQKKAKCSESCRQLDNLGIWTKSDIHTQNTTNDKTYLLGP